MVFGRILQVVIFLIVVSCSLVVLTGIRNIDQNYAILLVQAGKDIGGDGVFTTAAGGKEYRIPENLENTNNASYKVIDISDNYVVVEAIPRISAV